MFSNWRNFSGPKEKYSGAGATYDRLNREKGGRREGGGRVAVAMNWGNSQGAKEPSCSVIPLAMFRPTNLLVARGERSTGNLRAPFEVTGDENQLTLQLVRHLPEETGSNS